MRLTSGAADQPRLDANGPRFKPLPHYLAGPQPLLVLGRDLGFAAVWKRLGCENQTVDYNGAYAPKGLEWHGGNGLQRLGLMAPNRADEGS